MWLSAGSRHCTCQGQREGCAQRIAKCSHREIAHTTPQRQGAPNGAGIWRVQLHSGGATTTLIARLAPWEFVPTSTVAPQSRSGLRNEKDNWLWCKNTAAYPLHCMCKTSRRVSCSTAIKHHQFLDFATKPSHDSTKKPKPCTCATLFLSLCLFAKPMKHLHTFVLV